MNDLTKVEKQVKALMTAHGVGRVDFRFSKATRVIASVKLCRVHAESGPVIIPVMFSLSRQWATVMPEHDLFEVTIHEIAHMLNVDNHGIEGPHGRSFQRTVRRLGGKATRRCYNPSVNLDGSPRTA